MVLSILMKTTAAAIIIVIILITCCFWETVKLTQRKGLLNIKTMKVHCENLSAEESVNRYHRISFFDILHI